MTVFLDKHSKFLTDFYNSSKLDSNALTVIPSIVFLSTTFTQLYLQIQEYQIEAGWKGMFYKELLFHWVFFYVSRLWFFFMKLTKYSMLIIEGYIMTTSPEEEILYNITVTNSCAFIVVFVVSFLPLMFMVMYHIYSPSLQNLVVWVDEDPWVRSEIGISGHYLQRPAEVTRNPRHLNTSYRSKRSTSVDSDIVTNKIQVFRACKSMMTLGSNSTTALYE